MAQDTNIEQKPKLNLIFWITLIRGFLVIILGLSLLFTPEKTKAMLFNFMGFFWLMTGIVSIRQELHKKGNRLVLAAGAIGILAGCAVVTRDITRTFLPSSGLLHYWALLSCCPASYISWVVSRLAEGPCEVAPSSVSYWESSRSSWEGFS